jgi:hypothetical protein
MNTRTDLLWPEDGQPIHQPTPKLEKAGGEVEKITENV